MSSLRNSPGRKCPASGCKIRGAARRRKIACPVSRAQQTAKGGVLAEHAPRSAA